MNTQPHLQIKNLFYSASSNTETSQEKTVHPFPLLSSGFFRSKWLNDILGINPLISAAQPLFTAITQLNQYGSPLSTLELYEELIHEIKAFETQARSKGYAVEAILVARYALCTWIDELLAKRADDQTEILEQNTTYKLLPHFHYESWGGERFFLLLDRLTLDPKHHLDLLELFYLCLSLGFKGKYEGEKNLNSLKHLQTNIYTLIRAERGEIKNTLHVKIQNDGPTKKKTLVATLNPSWWFVLALLLLAGVYIGLGLVLGPHALSFSQALSGTMKA